MYSYFGVLKEGPGRHGGDARAEASMQDSTRKARTSRSRSSVKLQDTQSYENNESSGHTSATERHNRVRQADKAIEAHAHAHALRHRHRNRHRCNRTCIHTDGRNAATPRERSRSIEADPPRRDISSMSISAREDTTITSIAFV